jgi:hypothetical protein
MANTGANAGTQSIPPQMDAQAKAALESSKAAAMQQLAAAKNARPSPAIPAGVDRVDGPQKSFPDNMSVVPDVRGGGSISINPDGTHKFNEPMDMMYRGPAPKAKPGQIRHKKGGKVKSKPAAKYSSGGSTSKASSRGDGIAQRGKTKGRMI